MKVIFTKHPHSVGESYWQHFFYAVKFGLTMILAGVICLLHAVFPCIFQRTGSNLLFRMLRDFVTRSPVENRVVSLAEFLEKKISMDNNG